MIATIAALIWAGSLGAAETAADPGLPQTFVAACLDGNATMPPGQAHKIAFDALPPDVRARFDRPAHANVWKIGSPENAYVYVLEYRPGGSHDTKVCGLASDQLSLAGAVSVIDKRITGTAGLESNGGTQWLMPQAGYTVTAANAGKFNVLQINWLSERGRAALLKQVRRVSP